VVQLDLFVVLAAQSHIVQKNGVHGVPSLIIEIVSTNRLYDTQKSAAYMSRSALKSIL